MFIITNYNDKDQDKDNGNDVKDKDNDNSKDNDNKKAWQVASVGAQVAGQMHLFEFVPASLADEKPSEGRSIYRSAYMDIRLREKNQQKELGSNYLSNLKQQ